MHFKLALTTEYKNSFLTDPVLPLYTKIQKYHSQFYEKILQLFSILADSTPPCITLSLVPYFTSRTSTVSDTRKILVIRNEKAELWRFMTWENCLLSKSAVRQDISL